MDKYSTTNRNKSAKRLTENEKLDLEILNTVKES
jgi:hypothetical protein